MNSITLEFGAWTVTLAGVRYVIPTLLWTKHVWTKHGPGRYSNGFGFSLRVWFWKWEAGVWVTKVETK